MSARRVLLAGGSGFLGGALLPELARRGYECAILTRAVPESRREGVRYVTWDGRTPGAWASVIEGAAAIINFTGASVNCRLTERNKREIVESRRQSIQVLGEAVRRCRSRPEVFVQCSAVGVYGDTEGLCDEESSPGTGSLAEVAKTVEAAFQDVRVDGTRHVLLRIGVVLGRDGGALPVLARLTRCFMGGTVGTGRQYVSWIHVRDLTRIFIEAVTDASLGGTVNAVSPAPVRNAEFMKAMRTVLGRPWCPPAPAVLLRPLSFALGINADLVLTGQRCTPARLQQAGFKFLFDELVLALRSLL
jgi:uncharacterized protein (TIGR01777 family)